MWTIRSWTCLLACWALLSLIGGGSNGASAASVGSPSEGLASSMSQQPPLPPPAEMTEDLFKRRPSVDDGLRYSSNYWFINIISTPTSFILRRIRFHLLFNVAVCLAVVYFYPQYPSLSIPMVGHTLLGSSLGLLLSYRTNSAYARFWEARGHWTKTKATCRNLAVTVKHYIAPHAPKASKHFLQLLAAYPATLMHLSLGGAAKLQDHVQALVPSEHADNPSLPAIYLCMELHKTIHAAVEESKRSSRSSDMVEALHFVQVSHMVETLMESMSCCEKILTTPLPMTYSRHLSRFLTIWIGTLPFALVGTFSNRALTLAVVTLVGYCLLGIEEVSHLIEMPFVGDDCSDHVCWSMVDEDGEASTLIKRGRKTQPYDIGIPVCSLATQIRNEVELIAAAGGTTDDKKKH